MAPFKAVYGYTPTIHWDNKVVSDKDKIGDISQLHHIISKNLDKAQERMKRHANKKRRLQYKEFVEGDKVMLDARHLRRLGFRKLQSKKIGPFKVKRKINETTYELELPEHMHISPVFNEYLLSPYQEDPDRPEEAQPAILIDGAEEYEVEKVIRERLSRNKIFLLIRWKGYGPEHDSWQEFKTLTNAADTVKAYYDEHPTAYSSKRQMIDEWITKYTNPDPQG